MPCCASNPACAAGGENDSGFVAPAVSQHFSPGVEDAIREPLLLQALLDCERAQREAFATECSFVGGECLAGWLPAPEPLLSVGRSVGLVTDCRVGAATIASEECKLFEDGQALHEETRGGGERFANVSGKRKGPCGCEDGEDLDSDDDDKVRSSRFAETFVCSFALIDCLMLRCSGGNGSSWS